jgi:hypothetical protein
MLKMAGSIRVYLIKSICIKTPTLSFQTARAVLFWTRAVLSFFFHSPRNLSQSLAIFLELSTVMGKGKNYGRTVYIPSDTGEGVTRTYVPPVKKARVSSSTGVSKPRARKEKSVIATTAAAAAGPSHSTRTAFHKATDPDPAPPTISDDDNGIY